MTNEKENKRRRSRRVMVQIPITHSTVDTFLDSEIMNLSRGGIFLKADITLSVGTDVDLHFKLPTSGREIRIVGTVVWAKKRGKKARAFPDHPTGMGIQFKDIQTKDIEMILEEIENLMVLQ